jgi:hypothetical protein
MHGQNQRKDQKEAGGSELLLDWYGVFMSDFLFHAVRRMHNGSEC